MTYIMQALRAHGTIGLWTFDLAFVAGYILQHI